MDNVLGEIRVFPYNFAPKYWLPCDGRLLPISQNTALFSLLGTTYGGNGTTNFAIPDLRGRAAIGVGPQNIIGSASGSETVTLGIDQIPQHTHFLQASNMNGVGAVNNAGPLETIAQPVINSITGLQINSFSTSNGSPTTLSPAVLNKTGANIPHENRMPSLTLTVCIAVQGIFPSRN